MQLSARARWVIGAVALVIGIGYGWLTTDRDPAPSDPQEEASPTPTADPSSADLEDRWWSLVRGTYDDRAIRPVPGFDITLNLGDRLAGGIGGCNSYGGRVRITGDVIRLGSIGQHSMGCRAAVNAAETRYMSALSDVTTIEDSDERLVLAGEGVKLVYEEMALPPLEEIRGVTWHLRSLLIRETGKLAAREVRPATLVLDEDGSARAETGCGSITGSWESKGPYLSLTDTKVVGRCRGRAETQEQHLIGLFGRFTVTLQADTLTLLGVGAWSDLGAIYSTE